MRFTKVEILDAFDRQDRSYRLALLCTDWLRDAAPFRPSAIEEAKGNTMVVRGKRISFADLAELLEEPTRRDSVSSDFLLNQLHALIRVPFELLSDYCEDCDKIDASRRLVAAMKAARWHEVTRVIRNAVSHNFRIDYKGTTPLTWGNIIISSAMHGQPITHESLWHKAGYELFLEMRGFAEALPAYPRKAAT
jgi:hypothetical protein